MTGLRVDWTTAFECLLLPFCYPLFEEVIKMLCTFFRFAVCSKNAGSSVSSKKFKFLALLLNRLSLSYWVRDIRCWLDDVFGSSPILIFRVGVKMWLPEFWRCTNYYCDGVPGLLAYFSWKAAAFELCSFYKLVSGLVDWGGSCKNSELLSRKSSMSPLWRISPLCRTGYSILTVAVVVSCSTLSYYVVVLVDLRPMIRSDRVADGCLRVL